MAFNHDEEIKDSYMMESIDSSRYQKIRDKNGGKMASAASQQ